MTRVTSELRGRIVRAIVEHGGTARTEQYINAMADAHEFNVQHAAMAIPAPFKILGEHPPACVVCYGEGSRPTQPMAYGAAQRETVCLTCAGSGFSGVYGIGVQAHRTVMPAAPL